MSILMRIVDSMLERYNEDSQDSSLQDLSDCSDERFERTTNLMTDELHRILEMLVKMEDCTLARSPGAYLRQYEALVCYCLDQLDSAQLKRIGVEYHPKRRNN